MPKADVLADLLRRAYDPVRLVTDRRFRRAVRARGPASAELAPPLWTDAHGGRVVRLVMPDDYLPATLPDADTLRVYWRDLVQAAALEHYPETLAGVSAPPEVVARVAAAGPDVLPEMRAVLIAERVVGPDAPDGVVVARGLAVLADLTAFDPAAVGIVFPSLSAVDLTTLDPQLGATRLRDAVRPDGSADGPRLAAPPPAVRPGYTAAGRLAKAAAAAGRRNFVRAAVSYAQVPADDPHYREAQAEARKAVADGLVYRLGKALGWAADARRAWAQALMPLVAAAAARPWSPAGRALYDLQRIVADASGELSTVDPARVAASFGRQGWRRVLPAAPLVLRLRHLQSARRHLHRADLAAADRDAVEALLVADLAAREHVLHAALGPVVAEVFADAGLAPASVVEAAARDAAVAQLLARLADHGFLRIGDLRDVLARNQLKLPDLAGPGEWLRGDALLRADRLLADRLGGAYHGGEIYLRWIHRMTAALFATPPGRWLSRYALLPAAAAVMAVEFAGYVKLELEAVARYVGRALAARPDPPVALADAASTTADALDQIPHPPAAHASGVHADPWVYIAVAVVVGVLVNWPAARALAGAGLRAAGRGLTLVFVAGPRWVWRSPPVRAVRRHPLTRAAVAGLTTPLAVAGVVALSLYAAGVPAPAKRYAVLAAFGATAAAIQTVAGRRVEDRVGEALLDAWRALRTNLLPGLVGSVVDLFRWAGELFERGLYSIDEWLRFREGQSALGLALKGVLSLVWYPVAYVVRFAFNLLLEPQINPVKHFPVVTVSHKLLLPLTGVLAEATGWSIEAAGTFIMAVPGVFGFIVWELKENWRLYAANRPRALQPAVIGHHGETMRGYLRPGFHSGTLPRVYRKLRTAAGRARLTNAARPAAPVPDPRHAIADTVRPFLDHEFVGLLRAAKAWRPLAPAVGTVRVHVHSVRATVTVAGHPDDPLGLLFTLDGDRVVLTTDRPAWRADLDPEQATALETALAGLAARGAAGDPDRPVAWAEWSAYWQRAAG